MVETKANNGTNHDEPHNRGDKKALQERQVKRVADEAAIEAYCDEILALKASIGPESRKPREREVTIGKIEMAVRDLRRSAYHEAGHALVAEHFRIHGLEASVFATDERGKDKKHYRGRCRLLRISPRLTPYRESVIGWAGVIGEHLADWNLGTWKAKVDVFWDGCDTEDDFELLSGMSENDREMIRAYKNVERSFKRAAAIIEREYRSLERIATKLMWDAVLSPSKSVY